MKQFFAIAALTAALSASAAAQFIIDFDGGVGGNVTYAGGTSPLVGTGLTVGHIAGIATPLNTGTHTVTGGILNFTTGPFVSASGTVLTFGSGGSLTLTGAVPDIPLGGGATLMSASALSATFDTSTGVVLLNGPDTKNPAVLTFFGIPAGASFEIVGGSIHVQNGNVLDLDIPNEGVPQQFSGCSVTQGGWGAPPHGNNPGAFLAAQFGTAFPSGVTIGGSPFALLFTSAPSVRSFLPQGGLQFPERLGYESHLQDECWSLCRPGVSTRLERSPLPSGLADPEWDRHVIGRLDRLGSAGGRQSGISGRGSARGFHV